MTDAWITEQLEANQGLLRGFVARRIFTGQYDEVENIAQQTSLLVWRFREKFEGTSPEDFRTWMCQIAKNEVRAIGRRPSRREVGMGLMTDGSTPKVESRHVVDDRMPTKDQQLQEVMKVYESLPAWAKAGIDTYSKDGNVVLTSTQKTQRQRAVRMVRQALRLDVDMPIMKGYGDRGRGQEKKLNLQSEVQHRSGASG